MPATYVPTTTEKGFSPPRSAHPPAAWNPGFYTPDMCVCSPENDHPHVRRRPPRLRGEPQTDDGPAPLRAVLPAGQVIALVVGELLEPSAHSGQLDGGDVLVDLLRQGVDLWLQLALVEDQPLGRQGL